MCDCFHLAFPNWHHASSGTGGRRLRAPEPATDDDSICEEPSPFTEGERPRPQGSSPVEEYPEAAKYSDKEREAEHDLRHKSGSGHKTKKSGLGSMFERRSTPKMSKLKEVPSPEAEVIVKTTKDGCAEGLVYGGGGKDGIFIKEVVPESPASKSLKVKEGDQLLSATVYFDNVSYEDAIQILEHAQAYKLKLCLKRKPDITETEAVLESDAIPEEEIYPTEGREQGKTKRRGDARISWPKFPSFGKGRKSRFTRSHSSSEADEQRKLELSPTTSDTESPIKSQDALKGKKKHKLKLSALTKRGRISSSEDQDTDAPTTGQISGDIHLTQESDMLSPESLEGPSGETAEINVIGNLKVEEDLRPEQNNQTVTDAQSVQHKVELISIDSTLKTADLTVALADPVSPSDGKKKKKEKSELKMKILGKDKSHKKEAKAKASPKRLKALGASIEKEEQPGAPKVDVISSFESHTDKQGDQAALDASRAKQSTTEDEKTKEDPYERLSKSRVSTTQLPKREDIEIPGMEDMPKIRSTKDILESKIDFTGHSDESQSETVQLLIDVNSVKEAVSKLPGYKLPQVDTSGVPILEEITVIDANAQRISVKTPTKVAEPKAKHDAHSIRFDVTASPEISKVKVPKITPADLTSEELLTETKAKESDKEAKTEAPQAVSTLQDQDTDQTNESKKKSKRTKITMPSFGITMPDIRIPDVGFDLPKQNITQQKGLQSKTEAMKVKKQTGGALCEVKIPEATEDLIDESAAISFPEIRSGEKDVGAPPSDIDESVTSRDKDINIDGAEVKSLEREGKGSKFKLPHLSISVPKVKGTKFELSTAKKDVSATAEVQLPEAPEVDVTLGREAVCIPEQKMEAEAPELEIKPLGTQGELYEQGGKLKMPKFGIKLPKLKGPEFDLSLSKKDEDVQLPDAKAEVHQADVSLGKLDVSVPEQKMDADRPDAEVKPLSVEGELDGHGSKKKLPKFGIKMPKIKGSDFELSLSIKDGGVKMPKTQAEICIPKAPEADVSLGAGDLDISGQKIEAEKSETEVTALEAQGELHGQGSKFKMPKFDIKMPKFKGPEFDLHLSKKDAEDVLPQDKAEVQIAAEYEADVTLGELDVTTSEKKIEVEEPELEIKPVQAEVEADVQGGKFKKPKFGIKMPKIKAPELDLSLSRKDGGVTLSETKAEVQLPKTHQVDISLGGADVDIVGQKMDADKPELDIKPVQTEVEADVQGGKFKKPKFGIKLPKIKAPELDISLSRKDGGVTFSDTKAKVQMPETDVSMNVSVPESKITAEKPELGIKPVQTEGEPDGRGHKFKMPKFGMSMPKVKGPEVDLSLSKKDEDVTWPEANGKIKITDVELKESSVKVEMTAPETPEVAVGSLEVKTKAAEVDEKTSKFKMPKFGISLPKLKGPEMDLSLSKKDVDVSLPEPEADVKLPDVKQDGRTHEVPDVEGTASKFKMRTFEVPKLQGESPKISVEISGMDQDVKIDRAGMTVPEVGIKEPSAEIETTGSELDVKGSKFKMPHLGFAMPKVKGPKIDLSKKEVDTTIPEPKADFRIPKADLEKVDVSIQKAVVDVEKPELEMEALEIEGRPDGEKDKIKMPKFGIKMPKVKGPEFHFGLSKKAGDIPTPEAKADINLPDVELKGPSTKVEITSPETEAAADDTERSSSTFKMPSISFSLPKVKLPDAGLSLPKKETEVTLPEAKAEIEVPEVSKVEVSLGKAEVMIPEGNVEAEKPELQIKPLQTQVKLEGQGGRFKMPKFGITMPKVKGPEIDLNLSKEDKDGTLAEAKAEVKMPDPEFKEPSGKVEVKAPEIQDQLSHVEQSPSKFKLPTFKFPKFRAAVSADAPDLDKDIKMEEPAFKIPEADVDIAARKIDAEAQSLNLKLTGTDGEGKESKFKLPKFGISLPSVQGSEKDLSLSKKDVKLPKAKGDIQLPEGPEIDVNLGRVDVSVPELSIDMKKPKMKQLQSEGELDGQALKFKMPTFGEAKLKGPQTDLSSSMTDADVTLPEVKAEVSLPGVDIKEPSAVVEVKAAQIEPQSTSMKGSPSKFKLPTFKFPKFGVTTPNVSAEVPDTEKGIKLDGADVQICMPSADVDIPEVKAEVQLPDVEVKVPSASIVIEQQQDVEVDAKSKKSRFSMPKFSFSKPSIKASEVDVSFPEVELPEGKVEVKVGGEMAMEPLEIKMQKEPKPETELNLSKKSEDVALPEAEVKLPDVELKKPIMEVEAKAPEIKVVTKTVEGSPSKFKMPTFKLPKFGLGTPSSTVEIPASDKDIHIDDTDIKIPEEVLAVTIEASGTDFEAPTIEIKTVETELEGKGSKFKLPSLGFSVPPTKGPDVDLSLSKPDVDVTLPEVKAEVKVTDLEVKKPSVEAPDIKLVTKDLEKSTSKFKMPSFKLPKFGVGTPSAAVKGPTLDKDVKLEADTKLPEGALAVNIAAPDIEIEGQTVDMKMTETELDGKGGKFKLPSLSVSVPQVKGPDIDLSLSKTDVDVTLPAAEAEVTLPEVKLEKPSIEVEAKAPEIKVVTKETEGSPSKFKMPTFKLPKFGLGTPSATAELPALNKDVKTEMSEEILAVTITAPSIEAKDTTIDIKTAGIQHEGKGGKFKLPSLSVSVPQVKGPDIDLSLSKTDVDVTLPAAESEVNLPEVKLDKPSIEVEAKAPEIKVMTKEAEGSPSKFKMPTFKLPKFGIGTPSSAVAVPALDKNVKTEISEEVLAVTITEPSIEAKDPTIKIKTEGIQHEGKGGKFKLPSLSVSVPQVKGPDIDLSLSKKNVDMTLPTAEAEVKLPEVKLEKPTIEVEAKAPEIKVVTKEAEGSPSKFKMPTFKLPKFGLGTPSATAELPALDKDVKTEMSTEILSVTITETSIETKDTTIDIKTAGIQHEGKGGKFKLPSLGVSVPQVKGPDIDLSLSKKDVDMTLPTAEAEVKLSEVKLEKPSIEVEAKAPEIKVVTKETEGSPSKFKMPTFKLPKFGIGTPSSAVEVPALDKNVKTEISEEVLAVAITSPSIEAKGPSVDIKTTGIEHESKGSKFKLPSLGFSVSQAKDPGVDLSLTKTDVDVTLPEVKAEVKLTDTEIKKPSVELENEAPGIDIQQSNIEGSPSKFKMPSFKLPKFGATVEMPDVDKNIKVEEIKTEVKLPDVELKEPAGSVEGDIKGSKTSWTMPRFSFSKTNTKAPDTDINLEVDGTKTDVHAPDMDIKGAPGTSIDGEAATELDAKLKKPRFSLFSFSKQGTKGPEADGSQINVDVSLLEGKAEVKQPDFKVRPPEGETELDGQESKFKIPKFGIAMPKAKDVDVSRKDVDITLPEVKAEVQLPDVEIKKPSADVKIKAQAGSKEGSPSKFKMPTITLPKFGAATPQLSVEDSKDTGSLSVVVKSAGGELKKDVDITLPEAKLSTVDVKEDMTAVSAPDASTVEAEAQLKRPSWTFPKISFSKTGSKAPDLDVNLETPKVDVAAPETKAEISLPDADVKPSEATSVEESPAAELDTSSKKSKFSLPRFSFSKGSSKEPESKVEAPRIDVGVKTEHHEIELRGPEVEVGGDGRGPEVALTSSQKDVDIKADVKIFEAETDVEAKSKGSPLKFKMPTLKMPKFGSASYDVTSEEKVAETDETKLKDDGSVTIKDQNTDAKTEATKAERLDSETPMTETDGAVHGSPSKFKLPSFKMPRLSFSKSKPEDEVIADDEYKQDQLEVETEQKTESNSSKSSLISFGEILKAIDVEFDVPKIDKVEENLETSKEIRETDEVSGKHSEAKEKEVKSKQEAAKSPERAGWFKFPKFGLSSPSETPKSPEGLIGDEERSPTGSVQSSDAFADISSTITSEPVGLSLSSPTKVTVKYSEPTAAVEPGELHGDIITTRTELISDVPNLPEKITIPSSGVSSSSEDTIRLESGKIHVITSNIQATPETQHAKLLTAVHIQSAGGLELKSEANEAASWTVGDSQSGRKTMFERHLVQEMSSQRSESKETIVITKQITRVLEKSEPISGETASSIQRLKDSVHTEKMRFFDEAEK